MNLRNVRNWLLRSTKPRVDHVDDARVLIESPELLRLIRANLAKETSELRLANAIEAATLNERNAASDEDGEPVPRVFVTCPALLGMFLFSAEETERRIRKAFPDLDNKAVAASVRHLADRVAACLTEKTLPEPVARRSYVRDWAADSNNFFRL